MALKPWYIIAPLNCAFWNQAMVGRDAKIEPTLIRGGPHEGKYGIAERNRNNPAFADLAPAFSVMTVIALDEETAWPPVVEPEQ